MVEKKLSETYINLGGSFGTNMETRDSSCMSTSPPSPYFFSSASNRVGIFDIYRIFLK